MIEAKILNELINFQKKYPNIYIGGSTSLILQNAIPYRIPHDIDIISSIKIHIYDLFEVSNRPRNFIIKTYKFNNLRFELFFNPNAEYIEYKWKDNILKLSPIDEVNQWKLKNIHKNKHLVDLNNYGQKIYN